MTKFDSIHEDFCRAIERFQEILEVEKTDIVRDSAIKRFEIVFDLAWKAIKALVEERHNSVCVSPRTCFREAFRVGLMPYDDYWIELTSERNYTVHIYHEALAEHVYGKLPRALIAFQSLAEALNKNQ